MRRAHPVVKPQGPGEASGLPPERAAASAPAIRAATAGTVANRIEGSPRRFDVKGTDIGLRPPAVSAGSDPPQGSRNCLASFSACPW